MTPRVRQYVAEEAASHGVTPDQVISVSRGLPPAIKARHAVMCRLRADGFTLNQIGQWLGRNWATVMYATNPTYRAKTLAAQQRRKDAANDRQRERYATDPAYREARQQWSRESRSA